MLQTWWQILFPINRIPSYPHVPCKNFQIRRGWLGGILLFMIFLFYSGYVPTPAWLLPLRILFLPHGHNHPAMGEILPGSGTRLDIHGSSSSFPFNRQQLHPAREESLPGGQWGRVRAGEVWGTHTYTVLGWNAWSDECFKDFFCTVLKFFALQKTTETASCKKCEEYDGSPFVLYKNTYVHNYRNYS